MLDADWLANAPVSLCRRACICIGLLTRSSPILDYFLNLHKKVGKPILSNVFMDNLQVGFTSWIATMNILNKIKPSQKMQQIPSVITVRHPFDRLAAAYRYCIGFLV